MSESNVAVNSIQADNPWGFPVTKMACERCKWVFLVPRHVDELTCPHCFSAQLMEVTPISEPGDEQLPDDDRPPEMALPFSVNQASLVKGVEQFVRGIPYPPRDLTAANLAQRSRRLYLPQWLVDVEVSAQWRVEAGFDYEVVSHQDEYREYGGGWQSREVTEQRIRWEPRFGRLRRTYPNLEAPAIEDARRLFQRLGAFDRRQAESYRPELAVETMIRLPDIPTQEAWKLVEPVLQAAADREAQQACGANHTRQFQWQPEIHHRNWTHMLLPVVSSYYRDDDGLPRPVYIHGTSGKVTGVRKASLKRAQTTTWWILAAALVALVISLALILTGAVVPGAAVIGLVGIALALLLGCGALVPLLIVWQFNRRPVENL